MKNNFYQCLALADEAILKWRIQQLTQLFAVCAAKRLK